MENYLNRLLGKPTKTVVALALLGIPYVASASGELSALQTGKNEASISQRQVNNYQPCSLRQVHQGQQLGLEER
ncbi:MAG: hypothetical protein MRZ57_07495 [Bacteroidales bacterium]|nr:hypothetical protein [Bacteroidales bacterium]